VSVNVWKEIRRCCSVSIEDLILVDSGSGLDDSRSNVTGVMYVKSS
jgi:hypothetical protein